MRRPTFSDAFAFLFGLWLSVTAAYAIGWQSRSYARSLPAIFSADSVAGFQAIFFARTRVPYPPSGTEAALHGVRWRIQYPASTDSAVMPVQVTVVAESTLEGELLAPSAQYSFQRRLP